MIYETVIGLESHFELATSSKIFCGCSTTFGQPPNTQCCPVCAGLPGALPVLNKKAVDFALRACLAANCEISPLTRFDRKNYFYPDLPKAYQISQLHQPIGRNGHLSIDTPDGPKTIRIREIHMEEDAGKLIHDPWEDCTLVDYNRCGVPLLEIVSEPDLRSAEEALAYLEKLRDILQFLGVSDCRMQEGSFRTDVNVSLRPAGSQTLGTRTEMKNMNSFKAIGRAIASESRRQAELLQEGRKIRQETRRWDDNKDASLAMRSKENAQDYRYFPDPDLTAVRIGDDWIQSVRSALPELPESRRRRYQEIWNLTSYEADVLTTSPALSNLLDETIRCGAQPKEAASWIMGEFLQLCKDQECEPSSVKMPPASLACLIRMVGEGQVNRTTARAVFQKIAESGEDPSAYVDRHNLRMIGSADAIRLAVESVISQNPQSAADYKAGKTKALGYLMGQAMRAMQGKADPAVLDRLLKELLSQDQ